MTDTNTQILSLSDETSGLVNLERTLNVTQKLQENINTGVVLLSFVHESVTSPPYSCVHPLQSCWTD